MEELLIERASCGELEEIYGAMQRSFPQEELRDFADLSRVFAMPEYGVYHIVFGGERVGFTGIWQLEGFAFIEHIAISSASRGHGLGSLAIKELQRKFGRIVLEIEPPVDEITTRRFNFYSRLGFVMNDVPYLQPPYRAEDEPLPLRLMSYPAALTSPVSVIKEIYRVVYGRSGGLTSFLKVRKLAEGDDLAAVAHLIYKTDDYVFPFMFKGREKDAVPVFTAMIGRNTLYNAANITVAELAGKIVGIVVSLPAPITVSPSEMMDCFLLSGQVVDENFTQVYNEYYKPLENEPSGIYIANVCVDGAYRGMGIARLMLSQILRDDKTYNLETVKGNEAAFRLYSGLGFRVLNEYPGFTNVPCYRMRREKKE